MRLLRSFRAALTAAVTTASAVGLALSGAGAAQAAAPLPAHVFAPYFESWTGDSPAALAAQSGAEHLTMAFLQTASKGSCTPYWNGNTATPVAASSFGGDIKKIQRDGGDVIPSFGGYAADSTGTEIADSCTDVRQIAAAYEKVVSVYGVSRLDMDVEVDALNDTAGIDRRNKAIKLVQDWAAAKGRTVRFSYTLPTTTHGLGDTGLALLRNAVSNGARVDVVNIMTFDYYDNQAHDMAKDTQTAAQGLHDTLAQLYPGKTAAQVWHMIGVTEMIGVDDFGPAETFSLADASAVYDWAVSRGIGTLSFWALQRDNGGCPGGAAADHCSGLQQNTWDFTHVFAPFTRGAGHPCPAAPWSKAAVYTGGRQVSWKGRTWQAKWWTTGEQPGTTGEWGVWQDLGRC
ncbi:chitinase [Streptomyces sp. NPDC046985]|uniref:chitinase n=1 Tax=Streptomyces sp. NPDC046985 TaxID=3155377 RepID=UPI0033F14E61